MRFQSYFNTAVLLIQQYDGSTPLVYFLKQYFAQHKKHGSRDRKFISHLCYSYYRLGHALQELSVEERLKVALFLSNVAADDWHILYEVSWLNQWEGDLRSKIDFVRSIYQSFSISHIFPWINGLSEGIDQQDFIISHLVQPDLFLRIRPGMGRKVLQKLNDHTITFKQIGTTCLALPNASKIDTILILDKEAVVQDYSSQRVTEFLQPMVLNSGVPASVWDCCAASGGKAILAYDILQNIQLTVSDIRPSIIQNLKKRFERAGINNFHSFVEDIANPANIQQSTFDIILCDAPCSGSGTWGRTPEQLYFFTEAKIKEYAALQKKIVNNVINNIAADGWLLYITCSVFKKENEETVAFIQSNSDLDLVKMELLKGYDKKADSMFAALFKLRGLKG